MKRQIQTTLTRVMLLITASLLLATCGGGGGGNEGSNPSLAEVISDFQTTLNALRGDELGTPVISGSSDGIDYTLRILGFALCLPADYFQPPVTEPQPGTTIYGCANSVSVDFQLNASCVIVALAADNIFIDGEGSLRYFIGPPTTFDSYAIGTNLVMTVTYALDARPNGLYALGPVLDADVSLGSVQLVTSPSVGGYNESFLQLLIGPLVDDALTIVLTDIATQFAAAAPPFSL